MDAITGCDHHIGKPLTTILLSLATSLWNKIILEVKELKNLPFSGLGILEWEEDSFQLSLNVQGKQSSPWKCLWLFVGSVWEGDYASNVD